MEQKFCTSCSRTKPAGDFLHPIGDAGQDLRRLHTKEARRQASAGVDATATLQLHTTRLDDHEQRIACVEETLYDYDAAGAPPAPDVPGAGDGTFTKSQLRRQKRKNKMAARAAAQALDFVLVGDDAASDSHGPRLARVGHPCVRALVEENRQLTADLRGMRRCADPSAILRSCRALAGAWLGGAGPSRGLLLFGKSRSWCAAGRSASSWRSSHSRLGCARAALRAPFGAACRFREGSRGASVRMARRVCHHKRLIKASIVIAAAWRRYHILSTTLFGKALEVAGCRALGRGAHDRETGEGRGTEQADRGERATEQTSANSRTPCTATLCANPPKPRSSRARVLS